MQVSQGLDISDKTLVCKLNKSFYGLKQVSRQWYDKLTEFLSNRGYQYSHHVCSLFYKKTGSLMFFLDIYVDVVLTGTNLEEFTQLK